MISVVIGVPEAAMIESFEELRQRAGANVFLHPAVLLAAAALGFAQIHVLMAWLQDAKSRRLVGFWALRERHIASFWPTFLATPPYDYAFESSPVIDPDYRDAVWSAFFDAIEKHAKLPNVIRLRLLDADAATHLPMLSAIATRNGRVLKLSERTRPFLGAESERKRSGSTAKKLRQDWNRLTALGEVDIANDRGTGGVRDAFEVFLELEQKSWKGANGTALLSHDEDATFARRMIAELAAHGCASVALLRVDGKPIAAQVLLYSAAMAYTWKTAFDADFAKFSPGALLIDKVSDALFASGIEQMESCSVDGGFMEHLWSGRRMAVDLLADIGAEKSINFSLLAFSARAHEWLRDKRKHLQNLGWLPRRRKNLAATRG